MEDNPRARLMADGCLSVAEALQPACVCSYGRVEPPVAIGGNASLTDRLMFVDHTCERITFFSDPLVYPPRAPASGSPSASVVRDRALTHILHKP